MLTEKIGVSAMLEQTAEEASELAKACLKMARYLRKENPVFKDKSELIHELAEETADVMFCINEIVEQCDFITYEDIESQIMYKEQRILDRFRKGEKHD